MSCKIFIALKNKKVALTKGTYQTPAIPIPGIEVLRYWHGIGIGIGIENTTSSGIGIGIGIESLTFQVLELVLVLKKMTSGIGIGIDLLLSWHTAIK